MTDEPEEDWSPEDDKLDAKFKKGYIKFMERMMDEMDRHKKKEGEREARGRVVVGAPLYPNVGEYVRPNPAYAIAEPALHLKKISNGWIVSGCGPVGFSEIYATTENIGQIVHDACIEAEKQYEQSKRILSELNARPPEGGIPLAS